RQWPGVVGCRRAREDVAMNTVWSQTVERTDDGAIVVGGCDVRALAAEYGTPLYIVDEADFRTRARGFRESFDAAFARHDAEVDVFYAGKAFLCSRAVQWV